MRLCVRSASLDNLTSRLARKTQFAALAFKDASEFIRPLQDEFERQKAMTREEQKQHREALGAVRAVFEEKLRRRGDSNVAQ